MHDDPAVVRLLAPAVDAAAAQKAVPLGVTAATVLHRGDQAESPLGNLFTDAYLSALPGADVAFHNIAGGLRADLPAGPITFGRVFEVSPFDNRVAGFHVTGADLRKLVVALVRARTPALPGVAGMRVRATCAGGAVHVDLMRPNGRAIEDGERLLVAAPDFLATRGDGVFDAIAPPAGFAIDADGGKAIDAVVNALRARGGTLTEDQLVDRNRPRWSLPGPRPVSCGR